MKFRAHKMGATLDDFPIIKLPPTMAALRAHLDKAFKPWLASSPTLDNLKVQPYTEGQKMPDKRIGWADTLLVTCEGWGVIGYVNRMPA